MNFRRTISVNDQRSQRCIVVGIRTTSRMQSTFTSITSYHFVVHTHTHQFAHALRHTYPACVCLFVTSTYRTRTRRNIGVHTVPSIHTVRVLCICEYCIVNPHANNAPAQPQEDAPELLCVCLCVHKKRRRRIQ